MIIVLKQDAPDAQVREFCHELQDMGLQINDSKGSDTHILGLIGDTKAIAESWVLANPVVETCRRVSEPYKKANRKFHPDDTVITLPGGQKVKFWEDGRVYLGNQLEKQDGSCRCYGLTADENWLLVCEYGDNGSDPELVVYKRREK